MKILCTICVRGGSKGVKNKNLKKINNKPLIYYTIKKALDSKLFEDIVVSTDSLKIQKSQKSTESPLGFYDQKNLQLIKVKKFL